MEMAMKLNVFQSIAIVIAVEFVLLLAFLAI